VTLKVLLLSRYGPLGASSRVRFYQFLPALAARGVDVDVAPLLSDEAVKSRYRGRVTSLVDVVRMYGERLLCLRRPARYDLIWLEKELFPWLPALAEVLLGRARVPYVVDYDDAVFHQYDQSPSWWVRTLLGAKIDAVMRNAAMVTAGNDYLASRARRAGARRVEVIPSVVDAARYPPRPARSSGATNDFVIGWIGSPTTEKYLGAIAPALAALRGEGARLVLVGARAPALRALDPEIRPWSESSEVAEIQRFDVGIMPLTDDPWSRGKCGYKLIQYMAAGLPVVASPVGVNGTIVEPGTSGYLARDNEEWAAALRRLRDDRAAALMGQAGRARVEREFSSQAVLPRLEELLRAATVQRPAAAR
jgi:glycosyltransferase involved in cell wall biosynthesis